MKTYKLAFVVLAAILMTACGGGGYDQGYQDGYDGAIPTARQGAYFDGYRSERLPANLLQAQRDYFGAHMYERVDKPRGEFFHTNWTGRGGDTASSTYIV